VDFFTRIYTTDYYILVDQEIKLTQYSKGSGCGCKIAPAVLESILQKVQLNNTYSNLVAGNEGNEDAAAWDLGNGQLLLTTNDFFTPIVDDPYLFGKIASANALSDIYAMGGKPIFALAILGFPVDKLPIEIVGEIMRGANEICAEAGVPIAGGHSIDITEPVFGLVVNGILEKNNLKRNKGAQVGDQLFLTKALGTGIVSAALKRGKVSQEHLNAATKSMIQLNTIGEKLSRIASVHAMTDITGFGLIGHLIEMCEGSNVSAELNYADIQLLPGVKEYMDQFIFPDNTYRNWNAYERKVQGIAGPEFIPLNDPQTSGGLLISVAEEDVAAVVEIFNSQGLGDFNKSIGQIREIKNESIIQIN
jgi:selenide,water dikinase